MTCAITNRTCTKRKRHRRKIAVGTTVDYRKHASTELSDYFGVCLTNAIVLIDEPDAPFDRVVEQVSTQTRRMKRIRDRADPAGKIALVKRIWPLLGIPHRKSSYRKLFPICAGVSTVAVDPSRFQSDDLGVRRYIRAAPTGPSMPMVLSPTLLGQRLELCLVFRPTCITSDAAESLLTDVHKVLGRFRA